MTLIDSTPPAPVPAPAVLGYATGYAPNFVSPRTLANVTVWLLGACSFVAVVDMVSLYMQIDFLHAVQGGARPGAAAARANDLRVEAIHGIFILLFIATAIPFFMWIHRATKNLRGFNEGRPRFTPGQAVGHFFIPFLNLVRPHQIMSELWRGSTIGPRSTTPLITLWWIAYIGHSVVDRFGNVAVDGPKPTIDQFLFASWTSMASLVLVLAAGSLLIVLIRRITTMQICKAESAPAMVAAPALPPGWMAPPAVEESMPEAETVGVDEQHDQL